MFLLTVDVLVQDFVSLHDKYESESESRSTVRVVHVASQQVQASLDDNIKVATCYVDISTQPKQITPISAFKDVVPTKATWRKKEKKDANFVNCRLHQSHQERGSQALFLRPNLKLAKSSFHPLGKKKVENLDQSKLFNWITS